MSEWCRPEWWQLEIGRLKARVDELEAWKVRAQSATISIAADCLDTGKVKPGTAGTIEAVQQVCAALARAERERDDALARVARLERQRDALIAAWPSFGPEWESTLLDPDSDPGEPDGCVFYKWKCWHVSNRDGRRDEHTTRAAAVLAAAGLAPAEGEPP